MEVLSKKAYKTAAMRKESNFPIFEVTTHCINGTKITDFRRPNLPIYVKIALISLYDENCELKRNLQPRKLSEKEELRDIFGELINRLTMLDGEGISDNGQPLISLTKSLKEIDKLMEELHLINQTGENNGN